MLEKRMEENTVGENSEDKSTLTKLVDTIESTVADPGPSIRSVDNIRVKEEVDKNTSSKSDEFTEIEINDEKPPDKNGEKQNQVGTSQSSTSIGPRKKKLEEIKSLVMAENYCESVYNQNEVEILLHYG
jgi:hypothetical protein